MWIRFLWATTSRTILYVGLDISTDALSYASEVNQIKKLIHGEADILPVERDCFDIVIAFDVVEHLEVPMTFIKEAYRVLKPSGIMIIRTPNTHSFGVRNKFKSNSLIPSMYKDKSHISLLEPKAWMDFIQGAGFTITRLGTDTLWDIPYYQHIPLFVQKIILIPFNIMVSTLFGFLSWSQGENLIIIAKK